MVKFYVSIIFLLLNLAGHKIWDCPVGKRDKNVTEILFVYSCHALL